jgi:hypothetical protein
VFDRSRIIECGPTHVSRSAASQLGNKDAAAQRLVEQCHRPSGAGKPSPLFQPRLGGGLHDIWLDVFTQGGADPSQSPLRHFVLAVDEVSSELRQHHGMVAEHAIGTKVCRTAIQQIRDGSRLPTGRSWGRTWLGQPGGTYAEPLTK